MKSTRIVWTLGVCVALLGLALIESSALAQPPGRGRGPGAPDQQADMQIFHFLLDNRADIVRKVTKVGEGVETVTESDKPEVAAKIQEHVASMHKRIKERRPIHMRDPLFREVFRNADKIEMVIEKTDKGVRVKETSKDPYVARLIQAHADVLDLFLANGHSEVRKNHAVPPVVPVSTSLKPLAYGQLDRLHEMDGIFLGSQPTEEDLQKMKGDGFKTVINLREPGEVDWDEAAKVQELGLVYYALPFKAPETLRDNFFDEARRLLRDKSKRPVLVHCGTANRVGAVWLAYRVLDDKLSFEEAEEEAKAIGLKTEAYVDKAKDYIERNSK